MRRSKFVAALAASAAISTLPIPRAVAAAGPQTSAVADLRFGFAPVPANAPGFAPAGEARSLIAPGTASPAGTPIPGDQWTGLLPGGGRFVLRVPANWNGTLVIAGTPATLCEFSNDAIWSDFVLARGAAFASSNKRIPYDAIAEPIAGLANPHGAYPIPFDVAGLETKALAFRLGELDPVPVRIAQWNDDFHELAIMMRALLSSSYRAPRRVYAVGLANGGAQVRSLLETHPADVDGGVEWSGIFWSPTISPLDYLPPFLSAMPGYIRSGYADRTILARLARFGFPPDVAGSDPAHPSLYAEYYSNSAGCFADKAVFSLALLVDPKATASAGLCTPDAADPLHAPGTCAGSGLALPSKRATYSPSSEARAAIRRFRHTGAIEKPLISIAGTRDPFVTPQINAIGYQRAVSSARRGHLHRLFLVENGTHLDPLAAFGYGLRPQLPFAWAAYDRLVRTVESGDTSGTGTIVTVSNPAHLL
ncbi:MAG: hypothetical protein WCE44_16810 [Candidatus Velthaea sp.]|jgi:alpha-beta hydrolase superfamily lysophospholipase